MQIEHILLILGMCLVTGIPRFAPLTLLSSRRLNPLIERWLRLVPPAVLAAILLPVLFTGKDATGGTQLFISYHNIMLLAAIPSALVAWFTRSFFGTVITGMGCVALLRYLLN